ncbi:hypothetical protein D9615_004871 [Tricholomella constricta]|uniref:Uncharacterized protein n=1 Tax=Tricholomella constricta TaxID=117010 RepID=A0A8H5HGS0_9AGAR|nr:hypothetical protein D9615_004871 [Tricholomella constricta]
MSQMQSLGQAMQVLSLHPSSQPTPQTANTAGLEQITLPRPPRIPITKGRRLFYGFDVPEEWFTEYHAQNHHRIQDYDPATDMVWKMYIDRALLRSITGCRNLSIERATHKVTDPTTECDPVRGFKYLITVCSTMKKSYDRRPNQRQLDRLRAIFGREPEWFIDVFDDGSDYDF